MPGLDEPDLGGTAVRLPDEHRGAPGDLLLEEGVSHQRAVHGTGLGAAPAAQRGERRRCPPGSA